MDGQEHEVEHTVRHAKALVELVHRLEWHEHHHRHNGERNDRPYLDELTVFVLRACASEFLHLVDVRVCQAQHEEAKEAH